MPSVKIVCNCMCVLRLSHFDKDVWVWVVWVERVESFKPFKWMTINCTIDCRWHHSSVFKYF